MAAVTVLPSDETLGRVDAIVAKRRGARGAGASAEEMDRAMRIAKSKGAAAANEYLRSVRPRRVSRMAVMLELIQLGLKHIKE